MADWTIELINKVIRLWTVENRSASEIGVSEGLSRSTVMGKLYRLGLLHRGKPGKPASTPPTFHKRRQPPRVSPAAAIHIEVNEVPNKPKPFLGLWIDQLEPGDCRYPRDDQSAAPYQFCGQPTRQGSSYCGFHFERCCTSSGRPPSVPAYDMAVRAGR
jgi:GcrA cell cycle regulator